MTTIRVNWEKLKSSWGTILFCIGAMTSAAHGIITVSRYQKMIDDQGKTIHDQGEEIVQLRRSVDRLEGAADNMRQLQQLLRLTQGRVATLESMAPADRIPSRIPQRSTPDSSTQEQVATLETVATQRANSRMPQTPPPYTSAGTIVTHTHENQAVMLERIWSPIEYSTEDAGVAEPEPMALQPQADPM